MARKFGDRRRLGLVVALAVTVVVMVGLQRYAMRPASPLDRVEEMRLYYGPGAKLELVLCRDHARDLVAGAVEHPDLDRCSCDGARPAEITAGSSVLLARVCEHCLSIDGRYGGRYYRMPDAFHARYAAFCDSILVPVPGATDLLYDPAHEPAAREALRLMTPRLARLGAPLSISSENGVDFTFRIPEATPSVLGDHVFKVDTATGRARGVPRK